MFYLWHTYINYQSYARQNTIRIECLDADEANDYYNVLAQCPATVKIELRNDEGTTIKHYNSLLKW